MTPTSPAQVAAEADTRRVIAALLSLGGRATTAEIVAACGLPESVVARRLKNQGPQQLTARFTYFARDKAAGLWGVTSRGVEFLSDGDGQ